MHGKSTGAAIAAMSLLAERYDGGETLISATEIADARDLRRPFVSKLLTELSRAGLVKGVRGPGGGFTLTREPHTILLNEVYELFERSRGDACPFGGGICGVGDPCPLHDDFARVRAATDRILHKTSFGAFRKRSR